MNAHNSIHIPRIPVGTYQLKYAQGTSCSQFERTFDYTEQRTEEADRVRVKYIEISVTLHPVVGGNVRTKKISRGDFLRGHPAAHLVVLPPNRTVGASKFSRADSPTNHSQIQRYRKLSN